MAALTHTDLLIIGGGPAGLTAALFFSRLKRPSVLYDSGSYRNGASPAAHTIPGFDGADPAAYRRQLRRDLAAYPWAEVRDGAVVELAARVEGKYAYEARDAAGAVVRARKVVLATGLKDCLPAIPGLQEAWGKRAIHCVFCHGTETAGGPFAFMFSPASRPFNPMLAASIFKLWQGLGHSEVYILTHGMDVDTADGLEASGLAGVMPLVKAKGYKVVTSPITAVKMADDGLIVSFASHADVAVPYMLVFPERMQAHDDAAPWLTGNTGSGTGSGAGGGASGGAGTGGPGVGGLLGPLSPFGTLAPPSPALPPPALPPRMGDDARTAAPGVFWAGNSGSAFANVNVAVAQGQTAAAMAAEELGSEDLADALAAAGAH